MWNDDLSPVVDHPKGVKSQTLVFFSHFGTMHLNEKTFYDNSPLPLNVKRF